MSEDTTREVEREVIGESSEEEEGESPQPEEEGISIQPEEEIPEGTPVDPEETNTEQPDMSSSSKEFSQAGAGSDVDVPESHVSNSTEGNPESDADKKEQAESAEIQDEKVETRELEAGGHTIPETVVATENQSVKTKISVKEARNDNEEEVDVGDLSQLTEDSRNILFGRGLVYERAGKKNCALKCYLACLSHLTPQSNFVLLPQCLRNIADLYYRKEQYEKAILFIQAEKLFYENALIDTSEVQQKIEALREGLENTEGSRSNEDAKIAADSLRADEYEHLAKLCVDKKQPQLALEYAGKATKLRQKIFGNDNPITKESLDFFATLYAEVGKQQYSDSMSHLSEPGEENTDSSSPAVTPSMERSPSSILRQRRTGESETERKKQVRFQEPDGTETLEERNSQRENEEFVSRTILWVLFFICSLLLGILGMWLLCTLTDSLTCKWISGELQHLVINIKYYYYQYASTKKIKYM